MKESIAGVANHQIEHMPEVQWIVSLVTAESHVNLLTLVPIGMYRLTYTHQPNFTIVCSDWYNLDSYLECWAIPNVTC